MDGLQLAEQMLHKPDHVARKRKGNIDLTMHKLGRNERAFYNSSLALLKIWKCYTDEIMKRVENSLFIVFSYMIYIFARSNISAVSL